MSRISTRTQALTLTSTVLSTPIRPYFSYTNLKLNTCVGRIYESKFSSHTTNLVGSALLSVPVSYNALLGRDCWLSNGTTSEVPKFTLHNSTCRSPCASSVANSVAVYARRSGAKYTPWPAKADYQISSNTTSGFNGTGKSFRGSAVKLTAAWMGAYAKLRSRGGRVLKTRTFEAVPRRHSYLSIP